MELLKELAHGRTAHLFLFSPFSVVLMLVLDLDHDLDKITLCCCDRNCACVASLHQPRAAIFRCPGLVLWEFVDLAGVLRSGQGLDDTLVLAPGR